MMALVLPIEELPPEAQTDSRPEQAELRYLTNR